MTEKIKFYVGIGLILLGVLVVLIAFFIIYSSLTKCQAPCSSLNGVCFCGKGECVHFTCAPYTNFEECDCLEWEYKEQEPICLEESVIKILLVNKENKELNFSLNVGRDMELNLNVSYNPEVWEMFKESKCIRDSTNLQELWDAGKCEVVGFDDCPRRYINEEEIIKTCFVYDKNDGCLVERKVKWCYSYRVGRGKEVKPTKILCGETVWKLKE